MKSFPFTAVKSRYLNYLSITLFFVICGCTKAPYVYHLKQEENSSVQQVGSDSDVPTVAKLGSSEDPMFERGERYVLLDEGASWTFGIFSKLLIWNTSVDNHDISKETESALEGYFKKNNIDDVKVRMNQYAPMDEWSRLWHNDSVGVLWRATFGAVSTLLYTLLPGRIFGGDNYNPYTNTISIYSDHPAIALHEGGHAKDFANIKWKGTYAAMGILPFFSLYTESEATGDVLGYYEANQCFPQKSAAYKVLYPAYATYVGGETMSLLVPASPVSSIIAMAFVVPAHVIGRINAANVTAGTGVATTTEANTCE